MAGKNWNSKTQTWSQVVKPETKAKAQKAQELRSQGKNIQTIANEMGLSPSRIRELLR